MILGQESGVTDCMSIGLVLLMISRRRTLLSSLLDDGRKSRVLYAMARRTFLQMARYKYYPRRGGYWTPHNGGKIEQGNVARIV